MTARVTVKMLAELLVPEEQEDRDLKNLSNNESEDGPCKPPVKRQRYFNISRIKYCDLL